MKIGFTGTREGMTKAQSIQIRQLLEYFMQQGFTEAHDGVCIGSDIDFHNLAMVQGYKTVGHPGLNKSGKRLTRDKAIYDIMLPKKPFIQRNHRIVDICDILIATPRSYEEELRSGTWATTRYARKTGKPTFIVFPGGIVKSALQFFDTK